MQSITPACMHAGLAFHFARQLLWESSFLSFSGFRCFSSRFPSIRYGLAYGYLEFIQVGFPIRIPAAQWILLLPQLFAAYHVLHRLLVPRHPPCALSLTFQFTSVKIMVLSVSFHRVYNVMSSYCFDSLSLKIAPRMSLFPVSLNV